MAAKLALSAPIVISFLMFHEVVEAMGGMQRETLAKPSSVPNAIGTINIKKLWRST
jgi:hypothetical protein